MRLTVEKSSSRPPNVETAERQTRPNWRTVLIWAGALDASLFAAIGIRQFDREALAFAVLYLVGLVIFRLGRRGTVGAVGLGLISLDTAFWMVTATVTNLQNQEALISVLQPVALSVVSVIAIVAAVGSLLQRGYPIAASLRAVAAAALVLFVVVLASETVLTTQAAPASAEVVLTIHNTAYSARALSANSGQISVAITNQDLFWHTFTIDKLGVNVAVPVGGHRRIVFNAPPGTYIFYCQIPGHRQAGMQGTITVH
jgi:plastocyanin